MLSLKGLLGFSCKLFYNHHQGHPHLWTSQGTSHPLSYLVLVMSLWLMLRQLAPSILQMWKIEAKGHSLTGLQRITKNIYQSWNGVGEGYKIDRSPSLLFGHCVAIVPCLTAWSSPLGFRFSFPQWVGMLRHVLRLPAPQTPKLWELCLRPDIWMPPFAKWGSPGLSRAPFVHTNVGTGEVLFNFLSLWFSGSKVIWF